MRLHLIFLISFTIACQFGLAEELSLKTTTVYSDAYARVPDSRITTVRTTDTYQHFPEYRNQEQWLRRKQELKNHIMVSMGLYPMPEKTPLNPKIFDRTEREGYSVEKVYFESYPGFYVTGNLYRPAGEGPFPAILSPHGHWSKGRLENGETGSVPGRAINLARQGIIVFTYDMVGYVDSQQVAHNYGGEREWLWSISLPGLQLWNAIRGVDFLESLPDVDAQRIGCTGASGGGTQTFALMAVDNRVQCAAPVNMISAHFQGGCLCENGPNLRLDASNVELGAMMAPRPLLMVSATGDWTDETPWVEYPAVRSVYRLFNVEEKLRSVQVDAPHNYNQASREAVYAWFGKWFLDEDDESLLKERPFEVEADEKLRVFPDGKLPDGAVTEEELTRYLQQQSEEQLKKYYPKDERSLRSLRRIYRTALRHALGTKQPAENQLTVNRPAREKLPTAFVEYVEIGRAGVGDRIPGILLFPRGKGEITKAVLLLDDDGKSAFIGSEGKTSELLSQLLDQNYMVFMPDLFLTGEHLPDPAANPRDPSQKHFYTYNKSDTALRVQDILTSLTFLKSHDTVTHTAVVGQGDAGAWALLAAAAAGNAVDCVVVDANQFPLSRDAAYLEQMYIPGLRRAGDFRAAQAVLAPKPLLIHNKERVFHTAWADDAYKAANASNALQVLETPADTATMVSWIKDHLQ